MGKQGNFRQQKTQIVTITVNKNESQYSLYSQSVTIDGDALGLVNQNRQI